MAGAVLACVRLSSLVPSSSPVVAAVGLAVARSQRLAALAARPWYTLRPGGKLRSMACRSPAVVHINGVMSLPDKMRAEREANAAKAAVRLSRFLDQSSDATTRDNAQLSQNSHLGRHVATADENQKLSYNVHNCEQPATAGKNQKLSHSGHNGAQSETTTHATRLPQNLQSRDGKRLASLLEQYRRGRGCCQQRSKRSN